MKVVAAARAPGEIAQSRVWHIFNKSGTLLHVQLALSPWGQPLPWIITRDLRLEPAADLDAILDSHLENTGG